MINLLKPRYYFTYHQV